METNKETMKKNDSGLVKGLYIIAAVLAVIFVYMLIVNIMYISSYSVSYGMSFSDIWQEALQHIVTGSVSYLVYAVLVFCAGKIISMLSAGDVPIRKDAVEEDIDTENFDPDRVINRFNKEEKPVTVQLKQRKKKRNI